jgi:DNA-binding response OmpR family regulator
LDQGRSTGGILISDVFMRILIVEDYEPLRTSLARGLRESGFAVDTSADGKEGLWYAESNDYDVIILDIMLPSLDGLSILKKLRKSGCSCNVLMLTAKDTVEDKVTGLESGADDYLVKPFEFEELLARIRALVRRGYDSKQTELVIEDLHIDLNKQQVTRDKKEIFLTAREYALLEYLAIRSGQVVSRTDIWEHIYDFHSSASSNVVDVYIGYLRKKLHLQGKVDIIHTVRGRGYLLGIKN